LHLQIIQSWLRFFAIAKTNINNNIIISTVRITLFLTDQNVIHDYILLDQFTIENNLCIARVDDLVHRSLNRHKLYLQTCAL
jgi:hypothetical protein